MANPTKRRRTAVFVAGIVASASIIFLVSVAVDHTPSPSKKFLALVYGVGGAGVLATILSVLAVILGWFPHSDTRRKQLADLAHESMFAFRPFLQDLWHSIGSRPRVGLAGVAVTLVVTGIILSCWPGHNSPAEKIGIGLGFAGLLFGVLSYHVALRVEKSIRDSITDFREFLKIITDILEGEILCENSRVKNFPALTTTDATPTKIPDLILLLWFPYYGLTKDFNTVGLKVNRQLSHVQELACRTYLITARDPLALMEHFDKQYAADGKRYCPITLQRIADAIRGQDHSVWDSKIEIAKTTPAPTLDLSNPKVEKVLDSVNALKDLIFPTARRYWTAIPTDNEKLMDGLVQLVWTSKKAALVFMPPDQPAKATDATASSNDASQSETAAPVSAGSISGGVERSISVEPKMPKAGERQPYKCSGFVTEDPFMISMVRDLIEIRFKV